MYSLFLKDNQRQKFNKNDKEAIEKYFKKILGKEKFGIGQMHNSQKQTHATHSFFVGISKVETRILCFERVGNTEDENLPFQIVPLDKLLERVGVDSRGGDISTFWGGMKYSEFKKLITEKGVNPKGREWFGGQDKKGRGIIQVINN